MGAGEKYIRERVDIDVLFKVGFINTKTNFEAIEKRIVEWFGLNNIYEYDIILGRQKPVKYNPDTFSDN